MITLRQLLYAGAVLLMSTQVSLAQDKTEISLSRFFGACEADYADVTDVSKAHGECGIITALINKFNAESKDTHVKVDGCVGQSFLRSYATLTSSTTDTDDVVAYYGITKSV